MKIIIVALLVYAPFVLVAQEGESTNKGVIVGVSYSPDYCYRDLKGDGTDVINSNIARSNSVESAKYGFTTGLSARFSLTKNLQLETGLYFADKGERLVIDLSTLTFGDMIDPRYGFVYETSEVPGTVIANNKYMYAELPLKLNYIILDKKMRLAISGGTSLNTMVGYNQKSTHKYEDGSKSVSSNSFSTANFTRFHIGVIGGLSLEIPLSEKLALRLEPTYRRSITAINNDRIREYLYSAGMNLGVTYKLGG